MSDPTIFNVPRPSDAERLDFEYLGSRSTLFDPFVASTRKRFWDPADPAYIDFSAPFDMHTPLLPMEDFLELAPLRERIPIEDQIGYVNHMAWRTMCGFYYGEQAALMACLKEADELSDPSAVEYAINQAREESRHQHAFQRYIKARFGKPLPLSPPYRDLILRQLKGGQPQRKFVGVQLVLEGLGLATFGYVARATHDPLLRKLTRLVMVDEVQHHQAGRMLALREFPHFQPEALQELADEALICFETMVFLYFHAAPLQALCQRHGIEVSTEAGLPSGARNPHFEANFRRMARTLDECGLVTEAVRAKYVPWLTESAGDKDEEEADERIAAQEATELAAYNASRRQLHAPDSQRS